MGVAIIMGGGVKYSDLLYSQIDTERDENQ